MTMHDDEVRVTRDVAAALVADRFPQWVHLPVRELTTDGTVNAIFRVGIDLTARFPLERRDPVVLRQQLEREGAALRELAAHSPVPTPSPVAIGDPGRGHPLPWSVQTWVDGATAADRDPAGSHAFADDLGGFVEALRRTDTRGRTFDGGGRGGDLRAHDGWVATCLDRSHGLLDVPALARMWAGMRELPRGGADVMTHGDLIPGNVLVHDGRLAGVLDGGGFGPADPALDLVGAWHLLDDGPRATLRHRLGCDDVEWARGRAWAFEQALGLVWYYAASRPALSATGRRTLDRLVRDR